MQHTKEVESDRYTLTTQHVNGMAVKEDLPPVPGGIGDYRQAGDRIRDMDEGRCALVPNLGFQVMLVLCLST